MLSKPLVCLVFLFIATTANAQALTLLTEEDPPYSQTGADGKPTGFGVEVVNTIQQRLGRQVFPIRIQPWSRVYKTALTRPNVIAFAMSRTKEREHLFQWVGPIVENDWVIVAPKAAKMRLSGLKDAKHLRAIGSVRDYAWTHFLMQQGFRNLDLVSERKLNPRKAMAKHIDAFVSADVSYASEISEVGLDPNDFEIVLTFNTVQMYIAFSLETDANLAAAWQAELDRMKADGTFAALMKKWLPRNRLPRKAQPGTA